MLRRKKNFMILFVIACLLFTPSGSTSAYEIEYHWPSTNTVAYSIVQGIDANLGIANSTNLINTAAATWSAVSRFNLVQNQLSWGQISTENFQFTNPCFGQISDAPYALACRYFNGVQIWGTRMYFNSSPTIDWNTNQDIDCFPSGQNPRRMDFQHVAVHEFGHFYSLGDLNDTPLHHPESVMSFQCADVRHNLAEDDKQGATQLYGLWTGVDHHPDSSGEIDRVAYLYNVAGYVNSQTPPPELGPRTPELGVPLVGSWAGQDRYELLAGWAQSHYAYSYMTFFTWENDISPPNALTQSLQVRDGMRLSWYQYNYQQTTMGVDLEFSDGSTLRDSGLVDQNGVNVHPAARSAYGTGQWYYFEVDLSPLAGRRIQRYLIAYDNGNNGVTGQFRSYFDGFQINY